ncbi:MAG: TetR/AcrR family transcriptional regulator [Gammaproteobacteria bacterium]|nr:TetR family transcriptional regulator [Gammaproteobacteria bacterium]NIN62525.1 TetR family transcriptional regulator [Gammaproteobacteria bacterium]NIO63088.1 TetR family transcriptional regulator [Gammaproteobacteria bacterium]NIP48465.1 TetR/AcrR family transcriptional regulator [Gammaproteobacteria bacterium]NIQ08499.1 TetR/AcrR family transcriptional regulator [Gammaproteobacteria bacterium]
MGKKGEDTRTRILDTAQDMILGNGYAGVSIDKLISRLGMTKGAFFHHFKSKGDLATALITRFADDGVELFKESLARARKFSSDPLQQLIILIGQYEEIFENLEDPYPGCLLASYVYELQQFSEETREIINREFLLSRKELTGLFREIMKKYPPRIDVDIKSLADGFMSLFEGAFVLSKSLQEADVTYQQLQHYKTYIRLLFDPKLAA